MTQSNYGSSCLRCLIFKVLLLLSSFSLSISFVIISHRVLFVNTFFEIYFFVSFQFFQNRLKTILNFIFCCRSPWQLDYYIKSSFICQHFFWNLFSFFFSVSIETLWKTFLNLIFCCRSLCDSLIIISNQVSFVNTFFQVFWSFFIQTCTNQSQSKLIQTSSFILFSVFFAVVFDSFVIISFLTSFVNTFLKKLLTFC